MPYEDNDAGRKWPCEDGGRHWRNAAPRQRMSGATGSWEVKKEPPLEHPEVAQLC